MARPTDFLVETWNRIVLKDSTLPYTQEYFADGKARCFCTWVTLQDMMSQGVAINYDFDLECKEAYEYLKSSLLGLTDDTDISNCWDWVERNYDLTKQESMILFGYSTELSSQYNVMNKLYGDLALNPN